MSTKQIVEEMEKLPLDEKLKLMEIMTKKLFLGKKQSKGMSEGAKDLVHDYETDHELTSFTALDKETFYEAR